MTQIILPTVAQSADARKRGAKKASQAYIALDTWTCLVEPAEAGQAACVCIATNNAAAFSLSMYVSAFA